MIDIPLGKALAPTEVPRSNECGGCAFDLGRPVREGENYDCRSLECSAFARRDGKSVVFKLVDRPDADPEIEERTARLNKTLDALLEKTSAALKEIKTPAKRRLKDEV